MPDMYGYMHEVGQAMIDEEVRAAARAAAYKHKAQKPGLDEEQPSPEEIKDMMRERRCERILNDGRIR